MKDYIPDDAYRGYGAKSQIQCHLSLEHYVNPSISSEDFAEESVKKESSKQPREPKNQDEMALDESLSIDNMVHDLMQLPTSMNDAFVAKTGKKLLLLHFSQVFES